MHYHTFVKISISSLQDNVSVESNMNRVLLNSLTMVQTIVC